jgi:uncharacterized protein YpiB (UPF0302 family)
LQDFMKLHYIHWMDERQGCFHSLCITSHCVSL